jgi:hypothetical protein
MMAVSQNTDSTRITTGFLSYDRVTVPPCKSGITYIHGGDFFVSLKMRCEHGPDCHTHSTVGNDGVIKGPDPTSTSMHVSSIDQSLSLAIESWS